MFLEVADRIGTLSTSKMSCCFNLAAFLIVLCSSFDSLQNSQILDLSIFIPQPLLLPKSLCPSLSVLSFHFSIVCVAQSFTHKLLLGKGSRCTAPERSVTPTQYVAHALRRLQCIFLDIHVYIYITYYTRKSGIWLVISRVASYFQEPKVSVNTAYE